MNKVVVHGYKNNKCFGKPPVSYTHLDVYKRQPHIHCLVCEEAFDTKKNKMKNFSFISYKKLRKTWMYQVLDLLSKQKLKHFHYLKQRFYDELVNGFYVYAKKKEKDNDDNNVDAASVQSYEEIMIRGLVTAKLQMRCV